MINAEEFSLVAIFRRLTCRHEGETHDYCGKCGADLRITINYECRICEMRMRNKVYAAEDVPAFCTQCGAPRFTFRKVKKRKYR
ncbi:MAG: hypothetical protein AB1546_06980 [bacterium]